MNRRRRIYEGKAKILYEGPEPGTLIHAIVGTGWQAWPDLAKESGLTLSSGEIELPAAEDMLPLACYLLAAGKTVAVEKAEPVYLRNEVAWKKLPGRECISVTRRLRKGVASWRVKNRAFAGC